MEGENVGHRDPQEKKKKKQSSNCLEKYLCNHDSDPEII